MSCKLLLAWVFVLSAAILRADDLARRPPVAAPGGELDDPIEPLRPDRDRSEQEEDRLTAAALYAAGHTLEQRGERGRALRMYQRAYRYDPEAMNLLDSVLRVARDLDRQQEWFRYAVIQARRGPVEKLRSRQIGLFLTQQGKWTEALEIYERILTSLPERPTGLDDLSILMEAGRLYFLSDQPAKAAELFATLRNAVQSPEAFGLTEADAKKLLRDPALTWQLFGESFLAAGRLDEADEAFQEANSHKPAPGLLGYNLARVADKRDMPEKALDQLEKYFQKQQSSEGDAPYKLLASVLDKSGRKDELTVKLQSLRDADPDNAALAEHLAEHYLQQANPAQAAKVYEAMLAHLGDDRVALDVYRGLIVVRHELNDPEKLLEALAAGVAKAGTLELFDEVAARLVEDEKSVDHLVELAQLRREENDSAAGEALAMAQLAVKAERFDAAVEFYAAAVEASPDRKVELLTDQGLKLFLADQHAAAERAFRQAIEAADEEQQAALYFYLAGVLELQGQTDEAVEAARKAADARPDSARFAARLPWVLYHAKRYDEAVAAYRDLVARFDDKYDDEQNRDTLRDIRQVVSAIYVIKEDYEEAEDWLEEVLDEFPGDVGAQNDLGYLWVDRNKHLNRALAMIQRAIAAEPDNRAYQDSLGWAYYRLGNFDEAIRWLEKSAAQGDAPDGVILDHLGDAYQARRETDKAVAAWQRAAEAFEKNDEPKKAEAARRKIETR